MRKSDLGPNGRRQRVGWDLRQHPGQRLLGMPEIILLLESEPELRGGSRQASQASGHLGADRRRPGENTVEGLAGNAKLASGLAYGEAEAGQNPIP
jgi:hypothetical protein